MVHTRVGGPSMGIKETVIPWRLSDYQYIAKDSCKWIIRSALYSVVCILFRSKIDVRVVI